LAEIPTVGVAPAVANAVAMRSGYNLFFTDCAGKSLESAAREKIDNATMNLLEEGVFSETPSSDLLIL
jgi:hypothetical protein